MALTITHAAAADSSFSALGTTNWNANHTLSGSVALNEISSATGAVTIASGNNTGVVWNWANTTDSTICHTLGETSAASGGTSTSGVPNQVLLKLITVASSTQSPLSVYSRATHVFSVSPTTAQLFIAGGSAATPTFAFASATTSGLFGSSLSGVGIAVSGKNEAQFTAGILQSSHGSSDTVAYAINSRKSRGSVATPTVITTGDDLLTESGYGYLGGTNTYQEATRITSNSTGTISDATNGIGGIIKFSTRKQGVDTAVAERFRVDDAGHLVSIAGTANTPTITAGGGTSPAIAGTDNAFTVTIGTGGVASSVEVTFATAFANAPITSAQSDTDILALKSTPLTTKVTITASTPFTAGSNIDCICIGRA